MKGPGASAGVPTRWCGPARDAPDTVVSAVNYRRNGMKYSTTGKFRDMVPEMYFTF